MREVGTRKWLLEYRRARNCRLQLSAYQLKYSRQRYDGGESAVVEQIRVGKIS